MIRVALLATDNREHHREYDLASPYFGTAVESLLQGLAQQPNLEIHVISCAQKPMVAPHKIADNIWYHLLPVPKFGWLRTGYQGCIRAVRRKLKELRPDIVHGQGTERECAISAAFSGFPNIVTIHGNLIQIARSMKPRPGTYLWCAAKLEEITLPRTHGIICNSAYTESVVRSRARQTWLVPNAVREAFFETPSSNQRSPKPVLLTIGVVSPYKRQIDVLKIAEGLHQEGHDFQIKFIGVANPMDPYARSFLNRLTKAANYAEHCSSESLSHLITTIDSASALIHLPSEESFGLVVAEALARNLKFFGTDVGGLRDIADGVEGAELFAIGDSARIQSSISDWMQSGCPLPTTAANEMRRRYHPDVIASRHAEVYSEIVAAR
ncbi:MAG TPA: glycosyltransferase family 4 protein [Chthoniobacterales bacterium]